MKKTIIISVMFLFILTGCGRNRQVNNERDGLITVDITKRYPKKELILQDIAEIEYIPLETTDDVLLGDMPLLFHVSNKYILVQDFLQNSIFIFDRNGKIITHFNQQGQGDKEYIRLNGVTFDEKNEEIFVNDASSQRFLVYSISGEYKRTLKYPKDLSISIVHDFDDETLLVYDRYRWYLDVHSEKPYMLLSKKDGSIVAELNISLPIRYSNRTALEIDLGGGQEKMFQSLSIPVPNSMHYGQDFVITDISSDTIYRLSKDRELTPMLVRRPSVHLSEPRNVWSTQLTTDKFIILSKVTLDFIALEKGQSIPTITLIHEFGTGETHEISFVDINNVMREWVPSSNIIAPATPKNTDADLIQVRSLKKAYDAHKMQDELKELVATLDIEDNPIVRIVKFK